MSRSLYPLLLAAVLTSSAFGITVSDPLGDQIPGAGGTLFDLAGISVDTAPGNLMFTLHLAPGTSAGELEELSGWVEIDADQNLATGRPSHIDDYGLGMPLIGVDYFFEFYPYGSEVWLSYVFEGSEVTWQVQNLVRQSDAVVLTAPLVTTPGDPGIYLPQAQFNLVALIGSNYGPTDIAPNDETPYTVPEPASFAFLVLAAPLLLRRTRPVAFN